MTDWAKVKLDVDRNLPLYSQISEKLRSMILSGDLKKLLLPENCSRVFRFCFIIPPNKF